MFSSIMKINVLSWTDTIAVFAIFQLMSYLLNVWGLSYTHAAGIINVFWGGVLVLDLITYYLVETLISNFSMILLSSLAYSAGLGFLSMSTPPVLSGAMGTCSEYKPECIGEGQKTLFYIGLTLTAFGISGHVPSIQGFIGDQMTAAQHPPESMCGACTLFTFNWFGTLLVPFAAAIGLPYIKPWAVRFGIPAICTVAATLFVLTGMCSYNYVRPRGSALTTIVRVVVAATSKLLHRLPRNANELYGNLGYSSRGRFLRCLNKAAIILPNRTLEQQKRNRWRLCRIQEVEATKCVLRMIPMCTTFIMLGVVSSIGFSYFIAQADKLDRRVGKIAAVPIPILLLLYSTARAQFLSWYVSLTSCSGCTRPDSAFGMIVSHILAILSCITAAKVEDRRLDVVTRHGLIHKPDDKIPMSMFWLLPQFILLGGFDGMAYFSISSFVSSEVPLEMSEYMGIIARGFYGLGVMGGVLSVYVVGVVSEKGGKPNWFQQTLNMSRLDNYYWTLAAMTTVNLVLFFLVLVLYAFRNPSSQEERESRETVGPSEDNTTCCC